VTVLDSDPVTFDPLDGTDASSERFRQLIFNSLVRKNEKFEYVGDLASSFTISPDGLVATFNLPEGVVFHNGKPLTSADARYTLESLFASNPPKKKRAPFFEPLDQAQAAAVSGGQGDKSDAARAYISTIETPDTHTLVLRLRKTWTQLLPNLVSLPVIPEGSAETQKSNPVGSGPFQFVRHEDSQKFVDLKAFDKYWQGVPKIKSLRVRTIPDANTLQAELEAGRVDLVSGAANITPDAYKYFEQHSALKVEEFPGANIVYLGFNVTEPPLDNVKVRQAIAFAIDREGIVRDLLLGQARVAHSILPAESWAYDAGQQYPYDPARAKQLLDEAGFRDLDGDGPSMRLDKPISFKISAGNAAVSQYVGVIQNALKAVGIPAEIGSFDTPTLIDQLNKGQFQMTTLRWIGGNQDPIFLNDLFHSGEIPTAKRPNGRNRQRYQNAELDRILSEAKSTLDPSKARELYVQAQKIVSRDLPMLPLWYPEVMLIARKNVSNIKVDASNDFSFLRSVAVE
jgi:peptide/nickel transport system substrate-binding protein